MTVPARMAGAALATLYAVAAATAETPPAGAASGCPTVEAIAVPGTTQTTPQANPKAPVGVLGGILEPLKTHTTIALDTYYTPYPAAILSPTSGVDYRSSKDAGIDATNARLKTMSARCPKTQFLLTGYSQGADVAGDVAAAIGNNRGAIPANKMLGVALVADPSQSPVGQPTIGLSTPGMGFAGVRTGGFGSLIDRNAILSLCAPRDYYCNLPQGDLVMRFIGHLGSHIDPADPTGSAQRLATMFMAGLVAPAAAAVKQILAIVTDPNLIPNLATRGIAFAQALTQQLFWLGGPQVAATAATVITTAQQVIALIGTRSWTAIPALITTITANATTTAKALDRMRTQTTDINTTGFARVGTTLTQSDVNSNDLTNAVLNAISVATGNLGLLSTNIFGPTFTQFSPATVATAIKHFAEFIQGGYHTNYDSTPLDAAGHTGTQLAQRYLLNQINRIA